jgi:hypothetical protein
LQFKYLRFTIYDIANCCLQVIYKNKIGLVSICNWYKGHSDTGWYNDHKSKWNIHFGYWSFESGALVKILGLDDNSLKNQQYYPYDMVHWGGIICQKRKR